MSDFENKNENRKAERSWEEAAKAIGKAFADTATQLDRSAKAIAADPQVAKKTENIRKAAGQAAEKAEKTLYVGMALAMLGMEKIGKGVGELLKSQTEKAPWTEKAPAEPESAEPESAEPESAEPESAEPESAEPESAELESAEPEPAEPEPAEPESAEPEPAEPEPAEPEPAEPEPAEPEPADEPASPTAEEASKETPEPKPDPAAAPESDSPEADFFRKNIADAEKFIGNLANAAGAGIHQQIKLAQEMAEKLSEMLMNQVNPLKKSPAPPSSEAAGEPENPVPDEKTESKP